MSRKSVIFVTSKQSYVFFLHKNTQKSVFHQQNSPKLSTETHILSPLPLPEAPLEWLMPPRDEASELLLSCDPSDYSAGTIARAVEDCDAHLLNLNITSGSTPRGETMVHLRVSHLDPSAVSRSLARYGYETIAMRSASGAIGDSRAAARAREALHYLSVGMDD